MATTSTTISGMMIETAGITPSITTTTKNRKNMSVG